MKVFVDKLLPYSMEISTSWTYSKIINIEDISNKSDGKTVIEVKTTGDSVIDIELAMAVDDDSLITSWETGFEWVSITTAKSLTAGTRHMVYISQSTPFFAKYLRFRIKATETETLEKFNICMG